MLRRLPHPLIFLRMPAIDFAPFIKTRAQADQLDADYAARLVVLNKQLADSSYSAGVASQRATAYQEELDGLVADLANDDAQLLSISPGTERHTERTDQRRKRNDRREQIIALQRDLGGVPAAGRASELKETTGRVAAIAEDKAALATYKNTLPA